ncbi:MAG: hypothetical protein ABH952_00035 [Candidatus Omnitrophota bacterium]
MIAKIIKFIIGLGMVPAVVAVVLCLYEQIGRIKLIQNSENYFIWGVWAYIIFDLLLLRPKGVYVFGHEATHAMVVWIFGGRVTSFKASAKGGGVTATKSNFIINLAPYFIPFYTVLVCLFYFILARFFSMDEHTNWFLFIIGLTLIFHIVLTVDTLKTKQPDLAATGYLFSLSLIILINAVIIILIFSGLFESISAREFFIGAAERTKEYYRAAFEYLFGMKWAAAMTNVK